jgi:hypothetical protein
MNASVPNWRQMAEKLVASVCVLENLLNSSATAHETQNRKEFVKVERSVALQFPEDFFQDRQDSMQRSTSAESYCKQTSSKSTDVHSARAIAKSDIQPEKQPISAPYVLPESQLKLHQSILNFKQFNCSLKPLLAMLDFVLQDASGKLILLLISVLQNLQHY